MSLSAMTTHLKYLQGWGLKKFPGQTCSARCPSWSRGSFLQSCFPAGCPQHTAVHQVAPPHVQDFALSFLLLVMFLSDHFSYLSLSFKIWPQYLLYFSLLDHYQCSRCYCKSMSILQRDAYPAFSNSCIESKYIWLRKFSHVTFTPRIRKLA